MEPFKVWGFSAKAGRVQGVVYVPGIPDHNHEHTHKHTPIEKTNIEILKPISQSLRTTVEELQFFLTP